MMTTKPLNEWRRRYDASLASEREALGRENGATAEDMAWVGASCLPGPLGLIVVGIVSIAALVRRRRQARTE
jgi:hypothetical protein